MNGFLDDINITEFINFLCSVDNKPRIFTFLLFLLSTRTDSFWQCSATDAVSRRISVLFPPISSSESSAPNWMVIVCCLIKMVKDFCRFLFCSWYQIASIISSSCSCGWSLLCLSRSNIGSLISVRSNWWSTSFRMIVVHWIGHVDQRSLIREKCALWRPYLRS